MAKIKISVSIDEELLERVDQIAESRGDTRSYVIDKVLKNGIEAQEQFLKDMENPLVRGAARFLAGMAPLIEDESREQRLEFLEKLAEQAEAGKERKRNRRGKK